MSVHPCFLCSGEVESDRVSVDGDSFNEESAFVICHILEVPHWESVTTRSKFKQTSFCPPCKVKIKGIRHTLEELAALEKIVLDRKIEVEEQLRKSWEERRRRHDNGNFQLHPVDEFRDQILTEISSTKLLSTLTRLRENKIGRRYTRSKGVIENRECEEEREYVDPTESSKNDARIPSRIVTKVIPSTSTSGVNHLYSNQKSSASISTSIFEDPNERTGFVLSGPSHPTHTPTFPHSSNIRPEHMTYNMEPDMQLHEHDNSVTSELEDSGQSGQNAGDENSPDYVYPQEVCDVKFDPYDSGMEHSHPFTATSINDAAESAENAVSMRRNESDDASLFVEEVKPIGLSMNFHIPSLTSTSSGFPSTWNTNTNTRPKKPFKRPHPPTLAENDGSSPQRLRKSNSWQLSMELENKASADAFVLDTWCAKDRKLFQVGLTKYFYCKRGGQTCPSSVKLVFYANSTKVGVYTNGKEHFHKEERKNTALTSEVKETLEHLCRLGLNTTNQLIDALTQSIQGPIPTKDQVSSFLRYYRRRTEEANHAILP